MRRLVNRNKRGLRLDLKRPAARHAFLRLAAQADVVVESFRPGVMDRLGLGYERLAASNPRLVLCSISGYGQTGPRRDQAGHDLNYCAVAGVSDQIGVDAETPALPNLPLADLMGGTLAAGLAISAALFDAQRSGRGRHIDIAMADVALAHAVLPLAALNRHGAVRPAGADHLSGALACYAPYRTADGRFMAVGALEPKFWAALCAVIQRPDLVSLHRSGDAEIEARLRAELAAVFAGASQAEWVQRFAGADACVTPVQRLDEALADPQFQARGMVLATPGEAPALACPIKMSRFDFSQRRPAPQPGEHSLELLREAGLSEAECRAALEAGTDGPPSQNERFGQAA